MAKLIVGAATAAARAPDAPVWYWWRWPATYSENRDAGNLPPASLLASVRTTIAWFGIASLILVFLIACELARPARWAPLLAPLLLFSYESFRRYASQVYSDVPQMAFSLLGLWCLLVWCRRNHRGLLVAAGLAWGLACGTKLSAAAQVVGGMLCVGLVSAPLGRRSLRVLVVGALPASVFVLVNPHLWLHPVGNTLSTMRQWSHFLAEQQRDPLLAPARVTDRLEALYLTLSRVVVWPLHGRGTPGFAGLVPRGVVAFLVALAVATLAAALLRWTGRGLRRRELTLALACAGLALPVAVIADDLALSIVVLLALGVWQIGQGARGGRHVARAFAVLYLATLVATVCWLPFDWPRYYLPLVGVTPVLGALGAAQLEAALFPVRAGAAPTAETA